MGGVRRKHRTGAILHRGEEARLNFERYNSGGGNGAGGAEPEAARSPSSVIGRYDARIDSGELEANPEQRRLVERLDRLAADLERFQPQGGGLFSRLFRKKADAAKPPLGLYLHGGVGRGKTMLMDLFFENVSFAPKRRAHFHGFMADVHERIGHARKSVPGDPIPVVAAEIATEAKLLCFDELHVTDIADAMILGRLFAVLFRSGVVVVATSNAEPHELYRHGLNRQLFLPFIDLIEDNMDVIELASGKDFRHEKLAGHRLYFTPADDRARSAIDELWTSLTGTPPEPQPLKLTVLGRELVVPMAAKGVARFSFDELCARPLGPRDYLTIAQDFHTVVIDEIPHLTPAKRNEARRFINLIDALYDNRVGLIASAADEPDALYRHGDGADLFVRTASRLTEMRSEAYLESRNVRGGGDAPVI